MPVLQNARHERFAQELAKGRSQADAYVEAGYRSSRSAAARLAADVNICERVSEIAERAAVRAEITVADIARQLDEDREFARKVGSAAASVAATMGKAKVLGLIVDKAETAATGALTVSYVTRPAGEAQPPSSPEDYETDG